jgi:ribosomal protein S18 acetylase RimI-like enzyme
MADVQVRVAEGAADVEVVRGLMREYGDYLAHLAEEPGRAASICINGYESELAGLPAPYVAPGVLLLAWVEGEAAGCVALKPLQLKAASAGAGGMALELKRLWVRRGFRGLALGRRLMQAAIDAARAAGAGAVYLDTVPAAMPEANRLYEAMGFERVERYNDNDVADIAFFRLGL